TTAQGLDVGGYEERLVMEEFWPTLSWSGLNAGQSQLPADRALPGADQRTPASCFVADEAFRYGPTS
ncbi:unnamed protein product, partial [Boreogadus saida]